MNGYRKILVIRLSSFGDIVLTFPFLNQLRKLHPQAVIEFLVKEEYSELVKLNRNVDNVIVYNDEIKERLNNENYDVVFDLQHNLKSYDVLPDRTKVYTVTKETWKKHLLVYTKINLLKDPIPVYRKYLNVLKLFDNRTVTEFSVSELITGNESTVQERHCVLSPSSKHFTKRLPKEKFVTMMKDLNMKIVLTGDNNDTDKEICGYLESKLSNCLNLCGKLNYRELAGVIRYAEFVVCNDSGILHLSEALGKKVFVIFGSTVKEFGFFPALESTELFEVDGLKCKPCSHIGRSGCPKGHFDCMNKIDEAIIRLIINEYKKP